MNIRCVSLALLAMAWLYALTGCSSVGPEAALRSIDRVTVYGANPQFDNTRYEIVDLITALDPDNIRTKESKAGQNASASPSLVNESLGANAATTENLDAVARMTLERAFTAFYSPMYDYLGSVAERRNRIQDRLIGASVQRCEAYKVYLRRFESYQDTGWGIASTVLGGAGAIVGGIADARILGGLAGMSSGVRAEIRQGMFGNLASYVIVPGIEQRRRELLADIRKNRNDPNYTVQAALADVARYHGACSMETGMEQAKNAIQTVENPGLPMITKTLNAVMQARQMAFVASKAGTPGGIKPDELILSTFEESNLPSRNMAQPDWLQSSSSSARRADSANLVRAVGSKTLALIDALKKQAGEQATVIQEEIRVNPSTPLGTATLTVASTALNGTITTALSGAATTVIGTVTDSAAVAAKADACLSNLQTTYQLTPSASEKQARALKDLDIAKAVVNSSLQEWVTVLTHTQNQQKENISKALLSISLENLKSNHEAEVKKLIQKLIDELNKIPTITVINFDLRDSCKQF